VFRKPTTEAVDETVANISLRKIKRMPFQRDIIVERLNILDAAERVLNESKTPMTTREIIVAAKEKRYWISTASTPWATLHAAISRDIKTNKDNSRFTKKARGKFEVK
jgi:hypothetical protein